MAIQALTLFHRGQSVTLHMIPATKRLSINEGCPLTPVLDSAGSLQMKLNVQSYGSVFLPFPDITPDEPRQDVELSGDLTVTLPCGWGNRKCKSVTVGLRTTFTQEAVAGNSKGEKLLYETKAELVAEGEDGILLGVDGVQRCVSFCLGSVLWWWAIHILSNRHIANV
jgi:hypothetical protein